MYLLDKCKDVIGTPDYCICLDSGGLDYDSLWLTSSLRGYVATNVKVEVLTDEIHSGIGGGICPESFDIVRVLLNRLNNPETGEVVAAFREEPPEWKKEEAKEISALVGNDLYSEVNLLPGVDPISKDDLT